MGGTLLADVFGTNPDSKVSRELPPRKNPSKKRGFDLFYFFTDFFFLEFDGGIGASFTPNNPFTNATVVSHVLSR
jgi:hypothetical protein